MTMDHTIDRLLATIRDLEGALDLAPDATGPFPEIAWGDHFLYYAPDGEVPARAQPYATIVTKNYPDDTSSDLDRPDRWRLNIHVGARALADLTRAGGGDPAEIDVVLPHPVYRAQGWISIVNPGARTYELATELLRSAHEAARRRAERRG